jgi:hypothetical protein
MAMLVINMGAESPFSQAMHAGVERDIERQRIKQERQADFEMQRKLEEEYRKIQTVSDSVNEGGKNIGQRT